MRKQNMKACYKRWLLTVLLALMMLVIPAQVNASDGTKLANNSILANRSMDQVYNLYDASVKSYAVSGMFESVPIPEAGSYSPGKLSADAIIKTVSQINYFRTLAGLITW